MALVNAGIELARRQRRVLFVDFDLEAPGLDTFKALKTREPSLGIVDFVHAYLSSGTTDDVVKYVSKCHTETESGDIWLMPAGGSKSGYAGLFQSIDWGELYANQDGFLLMESLKQQWVDEIQPDYVLIDSRTGHTDVGGICTRQLPDAVAIFYFPNQQNLRGVSRVVREIRSERDGPRKKDIKLHFVMSNVPDLDDEHQILEKEIQSFKTQLELQQDPMMVHRYDSLSLLNQDVFTQSRPNSRLANEYRKIVDRIVKGNLGDRDGALSFLTGFERSARLDLRNEEAARNTRHQLENIEKSHTNDAEILYRLGSLYHREQKLERAIFLYQRSINLRHPNPEVFLDRARALIDIGNKAEANKDVIQALNSTELSPQAISRALKLVNDDSLDQITTSKAVLSLDTEQRIELVTLIHFESNVKRSLVLQLTEPIMNVKPGSISDTWLCFEFGILLLSLGIFELATEWFFESHEEENDVAVAFNRAIASWGANGSPSKVAFERVIHLHESRQLDDDLEEDDHYLQCVALAYWATGDTDKGLEFAEKAILASERFDGSFSFWRCKFVKKEDFQKDIYEMENLMKGDKTVRPAILDNNVPSIA